MITAEIKMGKEYSTQVHGKDIEEILRKITEYHTMSAFEKLHYENRGKLESVLKTGWYIKDTK